MGKEPRFNADGSLNERRHIADHHFIGKLEQKEEDKVAMWKRIKEKLIFAILVGFFSAMGSILVFAFEAYTKGNSNG